MIDNKDDYRRFMPPGTEDGQEGLAMPPLPTSEGAPADCLEIDGDTSAQVMPEEPPLHPAADEAKRAEEEKAPAPWAIKMANVMSTAFSPLLIPTYACAMALWITVLSVLPEQNRFTICLIVFGLTTLLPFGLVLFMIRTERISDMAMSNRHQRAVPFLLALVCYGLAWLFLNKISAPHWLSGFYKGAIACTLITFFINIGWKISVHSMSMGGLTAMAFYFAIHGLATVKMLPWILALVVISGGVMTSRLILNRHTPAQVYAGWALGFAAVFLLM